MEQGITALLKRYEKLEKQFPLMDGTQVFANLVTASTNQQYPVQRWFHLKEAYFLDLFEILIHSWEIPLSSIRRVLDPFCGTGTSLLAAQKLAKKLCRSDLVAVGLERTPFLHFVAHTKLQWHQFNGQQFEAYAAHLLNGAPKPVPRKWPELSTLRRKDVFSHRKLKEILGFRSAINSVEANERLLLLLGYASVLEDLSGTRKDGRMVRIVKNKQSPATATALQSAWSSIAEDTRLAAQYFLPIQTKILLGDGRSLVEVMSESV